MRVRDYMCEKCGYAREEYFSDTEDQPDVLSGEVCPECGGALRKAFSPKDNPQRWRHRDSER